MPEPIMQWGYIPMVRFHPELQVWSFTCSYGCFEAFFLFRHHAEDAFLAHLCGGVR